MPGSAQVAAAAFSSLSIGAGRVQAGYHRQRWPYWRLSGSSRPTLSGSVPAHNREVAPTGSALQPSGEVGFDDFGAMGWTTIPNNQQLPWNQALQLVETGNHFTAGDRMFIALEKQLALGCDRPNGRKMDIGKILVQDGHAASQGIGAHHHGQQVEARFVYEDDGSSFLFGLFFSSGQRSSCQRRISASLRCLARRIGF